MKKISRVKTMAKKSIQRERKRLVTCCNVGQRLKQTEKSFSSSCILRSRPKRFRRYELGHRNCITLVSLFPLTELKNRHRAKHVQIDLSGSTFGYPSLNWDKRMNERMARVKVVRGSMEKIRAVKSEVKLFRPLALQLCAIETNSWMLVLHVFR